MFSDQEDMLMSITNYRVHKYIKAKKKDAKDVILFPFT